MKTSDQINEIAKAMSEAQNKIKPALKDGLNPHFRSKYTSIAGVWESLREPMTSNGLTIWQDVTTHEKGVSVETRIVHSSGQWVEFGPLTMPVGKADAQGFGSCISYAKRYALCAAIGIVSTDEDDDAVSAVDKSSGEVVKHPLITQEQVKTIIAMTKEASMDTDAVTKFLSFMGVTKFMDIKASDYDRAVKALQKKIEVTS